MTEWRGCVHNKMQWLHLWQNDMVDCQPQHIRTYWPYTCSQMTVGCSLRPSHDECTPSPRGISFHEQCLVRTAIEVQEFAVTVTFQVCTLMYGMGRGHGEGADGEAAMYIHQANKWVWVCTWWIYQWHSVWVWKMMDLSVALRLSLHIDGFINVSQSESAHWWIYQWHSVWVCKLMDLSVVMQPIWSFRLSMFKQVNPSLRCLLHAKGIVAAS